MERNLVQAAARPASRGAGYPRRPERVMVNARSASTPRTTASKGMEVPAIETAPHEAQKPTAGEPTRVADEQDGQDGQVQDWAFMMGCDSVDRVKGDDEWSVGEAIRRVFSRHTRCTCL